MSTERQGILIFLLVIVAMVTVSTVEYESEIVRPTKSSTHEKLEKLVPPTVADAIVMQAVAQQHPYPVTLAAIAKAETGSHGFKPSTSGDNGKAKGVFQVQPQHWGAVPDDLEGQVEQATRVFLNLVKQHGYREAVKRWNGDGPKARKYQEKVLAFVKGVQ